MNLGSFGAALREYEPPVEPDDFEFCGERFVVRGEIPSMLHLTIAAALAGRIGALEGDTALFEALRHALTVPEREVGGETIPADDSEWQRFHRLAANTLVDTEWITSLVLNIMAAEAGRPTVRRSTSSTGSSPTSTSSNTSASDSPASQG